MDKIQIKKKEFLKGSDGYKTFSIRIKEETVRSLDEIVNNANISRNELINIFIEYGIKNYEIID